MGPATQPSGPRPVPIPQVGSPGEARRDLLAADRFATTLGIRLVAAETDRVEVEMTIGPAHLDEAGGLRPEIAFALADCAMSLISNQGHPAFAVAAHLVGTGSVNPSATVRAVAIPSHQSPSATT
jgi:acyl-coenzyme A thioesterase PaaI-like protein